MKNFGIGLLVIVGLLALTWIFQGNDFFLYKVIAPKQEAVRRKVFEETKSYNDGMKQNLLKMQFEYTAKTDSAAKDALASIILNTVAGYDETKLSPDLRSFIQTLRDKRVGIKY